VKQNKAMSWSATAFIASFSSILFAPMTYLIVVGKSNNHLNPSIGPVELFSVDSQSSGSFSLSYGLGALLVPAVFSLLVWGVLQVLASRKQASK